MRAIRLFQGYLWHPKGLAFDPRTQLPRRLGEVHILVDRVPPPIATFEDGTPAETQQFYQVTLLVRTEKEPAELKPLAEWASRELDPYLRATPKEVGWQLLEDLRPI
ncbi:MAG: DUF3208 domain-containing protein [Meiothermus sp.]|uniref:DUF3208 domain-containing protein n=1 Tax=Meiothermus sp. TaxID=1955249 RepID=UPI0025E44DF5|nr:DUF3208 domain-containing protein [Meiothermus sp.]MCS7058770.1 DUF3208 domain-containing protein [Meiothermus sp.]MCS7195389.1 DUF3208 domain-containing protein [Meiothermus sp.]MCX7740114.1 DUF3208 domain-containing protein [Meiothermus sp.]MDW8091010.1 DUF3208 domain-containing protein [Meiothermus sp.]MDW8482245.1 DUF3208 domain-containing protein [Meiothermus sp.]